MRSRRASRRQWRPGGPDRWGSAAGMRPYHRQVLSALPLHGSLARVSPRLELRLFGQPCVLREGRVVALAARKGLALLAVLALQGLVPRERMAVLLWPAVDVGAARRNLRRELFRLREVGLPLGGAAGALLQLSDAWSVDVLRFRSAADAGDDAAALALSSPAVLAGLDGVADQAFDLWLAGQRTTLAGTRQRVRERLARHLQGQGQTEAALDLWLQALDEDACQEAVLAAAMTILHELGDNARALALYERSESALREALDVEPSPTLQAMAAGLRRSRPLPPAAPTARRRSDAPSLRSVDRQAAVDRVLAAWQQGRRVYLSGVPGVGKTQLACACAGQRGGWVRVPCRPDDAEQPYSSAVRAFLVLREAAADVVLPPWVRRELSQLLPELGEAPRPLESPAARQRLLGAFAAAIALLAHDNFAALVLDDWQWCDADSQALLAPLGQRDDALACVLVFRTAQLPPALLQAMRAEVDNGEAERFELDGFDEADTRELLAGAAARDDPDDETRAWAHRLHAATGGNPFFLVETLRQLHERGRLAADTQGRWRGLPRPAGAAAQPLALPASVRDAVLGRVRALGEDLRRNLEAASLLGTAFDAAMLDGMAGSSADELVALLEHAEAARLVRPDGRGYRFAHDLVGQCLADTLSPARRQVLHRRWAARLTQRQAAPARVAAQFELAGQPTLALPWRLRAAEEAQRVHALADAQRQFELALADGAQGDDAVQVHLALVRLHQLRADAAAAAQALTAATQAASTAGFESRLQVRLAHVTQRNLAQQPADALALLDGLSGELAAAPAALRARALIARGNALRLLGRYDEASSVDEQAIALLESLPDALAALGAALDGVARRLLSRGQPAAALPYASRAAAALESVDDPSGLARTLVIVGVSMLHAQGDREQARAVFERARALAAGCGDVEQQRAAILNLVKLATDRGDSAAALALLDEGESLAPQYDNASVEQGFAVARYYVHYMRGDADGSDAGAQHLLAVQRRLASGYQQLTGISQVLDFYLHAGRAGDAAALLGEAAAIAAGGGSPRPLLLELRLKSAWLHLLRGDGAAAQVELDTLDREDEALHPAASVFESGLLRARIGAQVALARSDPEQAERCLAAVDLAQPMPTDHEALLLAQHLALAACRRQPPGSLRERALRLLDADQVPAFEAAALRHALRAV